MEIWPIKLRSIKKLKVNVISTFLVLLLERGGGGVQWPHESKLENQSEGFRL